MRAVGDKARISVQDEQQGRWKWLLNTLLICFLLLAMLLLAVWLSSWLSGFLNSLATVQNANGSVGHPTQGRRR